MAPELLTPENRGMVTKLSSIPEDKTLTDLFGDFMSYLLECTRSYIQETHLPNGTVVWQSVEKDIQFVISHPNGWEAAQQAELRDAAVAAGLIQDTNKGHARLQFITEGEASLHYCIMNGLSRDTEVFFFCFLSFHTKFDFRTYRTKEESLWSMRGVGLSMRVPTNIKSMEENQSMRRSLPLSVNSNPFA